MSEITSKKGLFLIAVLTVVLVGFLSIGIIRDKKIQKQNNNDYNAWLQAKNDSDSSSSTPKDNDEQKKSAANNQKADIKEKIKNKQDIKVLVLGDGLALSAGRQSDNGIWQNGFKSEVESKFGCKTEMVSLAQNKSTTDKGVQAASGVSDFNIYDLVIICFGHNDNLSKVSIKEFQDSYTKIVSKIKQSNDKVKIISVLPNTLDTDNEYRKIIIEIAKNNKIDTADVKASFNSYGKSESKLLNQGIPNDKGYEVYTKTIFDAFSKEVK